MKTPENDLFEITVAIKGEPRRVLVRVIDQKSSQFRVQVDGLPTDDDINAPSRDLTLIGTDFPGHFQARPLGNLKAYLGRHPDLVRAALAAGAVNLSNLMLARTVTLMATEGLGAQEAMGRAMQIGEELRQWLQATRDAAENARRASAGGV